MSPPILALERVEVDYLLEDDVVSAVSDVSLSVAPGEIVGIVGESGCGKSTLALAIMGLLGSRARVRGRIDFDGQDLVSLSEKQLRMLRGDRLAMVFQDPLTSLDPAYGVGEQVAEAIRAHRDVTTAEARQKALGLLRDVGIPAAELRYDDPPHRLSGGMRQRVVVATALANDPLLLIADEPSTALDVTIQAQILDLMRTLQKETGTAIILITHDLGVVAEMCDRVAVMYAGEIVEQTDVRTLFAEPHHPYTQGLIGAVPVPGDIRDELATIPGSVPNLIELPPACRFAPRCLARTEHGNVLAERVHPELLPVADGHSVRCWLYHHEDGTRRASPDEWPEASPA